MTITNIFSLVGGLGLFLYGMNAMSHGLEEAAGNKMQSILEKLTSNKFLGVLVGALITALIQSSSATTVMVVGFVNSGLMTLSGAVWVIMGANIGTTITGQLIALDITAMAPLISFIGVAMIVFFKNQRVNAVGQILAGLGILFMGMDMMSTAMEPLRSMPEFINIITTFENPLIGILVGALFTAVIQSSSASVGILQALAMSGVITLPSAIYVLYGQNIGTCITSVLASIGAERNAKRATVIHLSFNIIGTILFVGISMMTPFASIVASSSPNSVATQIANVHTIFNVVTTIILLPFGSYLVKLSYIILPENKDEKEEKLSLKYLDFTIFDNDYHVATRAIITTQLFNEVQNMLSVTSDNVRRSFELLMDYDDHKYEKLVKYEEYIDYLNEQIVTYTTNAITLESIQNEPEIISTFLKIVSNLERIGDHAFNIAARAKSMNAKNKHFSAQALEEIDIMEMMCVSMLEELKIISPEELEEVVAKVDVIEEGIDATTDEFSREQLKRLKNKECHTDNSIRFTKTLSDFERIGDHGLNIAKSFNELRHSLNALRLQFSKD